MAVMISEEPSPCHADTRIIHPYVTDTSGSNGRRSALLFVIVPAGVGILLRTGNVAAGLALAWRWPGAGP
jgi:hypothetical protein